MELPGRCGDWLDTATVTAQGLSSRSTRRARGGDLHLAISGDFSLATSGDFGMAADRLHPSQDSPFPDSSGRFNRTSNLASQNTQGRASPLGNACLGEQTTLVICQVAPGL